MLRIGSVWGVPIYVTPSWLLVAAFITVAYADFMRDQLPDVTTRTSYLMALVYAVALAVSVLLHELGHTAVSRLVGLPVRRIVVFLLGGVSEIDGEAARPRDEFVIAASGPAASFGLAGVCWAASLLTGHDTAPSVLLLLLAWSNLVIAVFNVLPGLPLDGGRIVQSAVWAMSGSRYTGVRAAAWSGRAMAALLALGVLIANSMVADDSRVHVTTLLAAAMGFAIAAFLWLGATQSLRSATIGERAAALRLRDLLRPAVYVGPATPLSEAVRIANEAGAAGIVIIDGQGRSRAIVREADVLRLPPRQRPWSAVSEFGQALEPGLIMREDLAGTDLIDAVQSHPASEYLVIGADGVARGVMAASDLATALSRPRPRPAHM